MARTHGVRLPVMLRPIDWLLSPVQEFLRIEAAGGILLLLSAVAAMLWANFAPESYEHFWHAPVTIQIGSLVDFRDKTIGHLLINDGLMVLFFFVVGLEIKREMIAGELASARKAAVPIAAAVGGMLVPAMIYAVINGGTEEIRGWAIPCATDIAFALGIMAMLGRRVPVQLKVFLTALAIVDDIGAVLIIALFYTSELQVDVLLAAAGVLGLLILANLAGIRRPAVYIFLGVVLWVCVFLSGIHATIAGVLLAFTIPTKYRIRGADFVRFARRAVDEFEAAGGNDNDVLTNPRRQQWVHGLESACESVHTPLLRMEHYLHPWSSFLIVPVFALANAGVRLEGLGGMLTSRLSLGIILGLILGKQIGVTLCTWLAVRLGIGDLPEGVTWRQIYAASWLAGIGFTMSLFIANLGFGEGAQLDSSKAGVLTGSLLAGVIGLVLLRLFTAPPSPEEA